MVCLEDQYRLEQTHSRTEAEFVLLLETNVSAVA